MDERICFPYKDTEKDIPEFVNDMMQVYTKMLDDISQRIFVNRLLLSLTEDYGFMRNVILYTNGGRRLNDTIQMRNTKPQYIYGAGIRGKRLFELFPDNNWGGFIDQNNKKKGYHNIKIMNLEEFIVSYTPGTAIWVSNKLETRDIVNRLLEVGIALEDIYVINDFDLEGTEGIYFSIECMKPEQERAFVDIGCFDGKDSLNYMKWINNSKAKIYAFEPDRKNYEACKKNLDGYSNIELLNIGLSDKEEELYIAGEGDMTYLGKYGDLKVTTRLLDNVIQNKSVGFIKMDVEGYEEKVLRGAEKIIRNEHPVLAISLYHKRSDIWRIPKLLLMFNCNYRFYMRYYGAASGDTVLYAVDEKNN